MRKFKKFLCAVLASTMVLAMAAPSFAATTEQTKIVIENATKNQTYRIYKILDAKTNGKESDAASYSYTVNEDWAAFFEIGLAADYFDIIAGNAVWKGDRSDTRAAEFAKLALDYATGKAITQGNITIDATAKDEDGNFVPRIGSSSITPSFDEDNKTMTFQGIGFGYFLVDSTVGTLVTLDTNATTQTIKDKNEAAKIKKELVNPSQATVTIGDDVEYVITITAQEGAENYTIHDVMNGLAFKEIKSVTLDGNPVDNKNNKNYESPTTDNEDGCSFELKFTQDFCNTLKKDNKIAVTYVATVTEAALANNNEATNDASLKYGENNNITSTPAETVTSKMYELDLMKVNGNNELLSGAEFKLYKKTEKLDDNGEPVYDYTRIKVAKIDDTTYRADGVDANDTDTTMIEAGLVTIKGLGNGKYVFLEETAPVGYNKLDTYTEVLTITDANNKVKTEERNGVKTYLSGGIHVINNTGSLLPSTGGIGTTIFYAAGIILMAGAVFFVVRRKRV